MMVCVGGGGGGGGGGQRVQLYEHSSCSSVPIVHSIFSICMLLIYITTILSPRVIQNIRACIIRICQNTKKQGRK